MEKIAEEYQTLVDMKMAQMGLDRVISYEVFHDPDFKVKDDFKVGYVIITPKKIRDNTKVTDVLIFFNESYLDELSLVKDAPLLDLAMDKVLNSIEFDFSKDILKKSNENVIEFESILNKYGISFVVETYRLTITQITEKLQ